MTPSQLYGENPIRPTPDETAIGVTARECCGGCRYWEGVESNPFGGWCLRYPAKVYKQHVEWCGEYAPRRTAVCVLQEADE